MKYLFILACTLLSAHTFSQNFAADVATAKTAYAANKLDDAHFALQQALQEVDIIIGKKVIASLPVAIDKFKANTNNDEVVSNTGFMGSTIHRSWGENDDVDLSIVGNSPLIGSISTFVNTPLLGGMMSNGNNKIIKVQGYKGQLLKEDGGNGQTNFTVQIPLGSSLITFKANNCTDTQITTWVNTLQLQQIAKLLE